VPGRRRCGCRFDGVLGPPGRHPRKSASRAGGVRPRSACAALTWVPRYWRPSPTRSAPMGPAGARGAACGLGRVFRAGVGAVLVASWAHQVGTHGAGWRPWRGVRAGSGVQGRCGCRFGGVLGPPGRHPWGRLAPVARRAGWVGCSGPVWVPFCWRPGPTRSAPMGRAGTLSPLQAGWARPGGGPARRRKLSPGGTRRLVQPPAAPGGG
jgi:hypothetical protein